MSVKKIKKRSAVRIKALPKDCPLLLLMALAVVFLMMITLVFYVYAALSFQKNFFTSPLAQNEGRYVVEVLNYSGYQAPVDFPKELVKGKIGDFNSSQEMRYPGQGKLNYVSFESKISPQSLVIYYANYLFRQAYEGQVARYDNSIAQIVAVRGGMNYRFMITPSVKGSTVSIYQVATK